ncbi:MAG TPA: macro domain-containing protein [Candidatus Dormibacteraeota bacterium]
MRADITTLRVDAVVNAANTELAGGGGVDGAIHRAAGHAALQAELRERYPQGCPTGSAVITGALGLARNGVRHIVHAVGPRWSDAQPERCDGQLGSAYATAVRLAAEADCGTVALPSLATGIYGFPVERAAPIALGACAAALTAAGTPLRELSFALYSEADLAAYGRALAGVGPAREPGADGLRPGG